MAQADTKKLDSGDRFPEIQLSLIDGGSLSLPVETEGRWTIFIVNRGHW